MTYRIPRRRFLQSSVQLGFAAGVLPLLKPSRVLGANERLNIGVIGVGGRGAGDLAAVAGENIVALCDVDEGRLNAAAGQHAAAEKYFDYRELPEDQFADFKGPEPYLPKSPGHHAQWIAACKTGSRTGSNFGYSGPFTEIVLLGNVAFRAGTTVGFDPATGKITNAPKAEQFLTKSYRKGWEL